MRQLDAAILSGASSARVARQIGVNEVTVRRRKATLGREGHVFPIAQRDRREDNHATQHS
jgi:transposase-like protein